MSPTFDVPSKPRRRTALLGRAAAVFAAFGLASCASSVKVKYDSGSVTKEALRQTDLLRANAGPPPTVLSTFAAESRKLLKNAQHLELLKSRKADAAACYLKAALDAQREIVSGKEPRGSESEKALVHLHNHALSRFVELWIDDPRRDGTNNHTFEIEGETIKISLAPNSTYKAGYFDSGVPALSVIEQKGITAETREGWGAAIVGIRNQTPERAMEMKYYPKKGLYAPATLTMDSVTELAGVAHVSFSLRNPMLEQTTRVGGLTMPVAGDFSAPIAVILNKQSEQGLGLEGFFKADQRTGVTGIFLSEPYDPNRIPVLLIHGIISVPMIWRDIIPEMLADPEISKRYQMMVFAYPSGLPIVESAKLLRHDLAEMRKHYDPDGNDPLSRNMVVAGHSMGGILTRTLVVDMGDNLWRQFNDTESLDQTPISEEERKKLRELVYFDADPAALRAVYFSAPHRGAELAEKGIVGVVSKLAKLPSTARQVSRDLFAPVVITNEKFRETTKSTYTSVQSLMPGAPMVAALEKAPYRTGVTYHSIMGDRGKGDTPNSSDGFVEYWSSHQEGAASELIVPVGHESYKSPLAIEELKRVLRLHAGIR
jgi:pimeloyl-ACP methyl ester carboxylesterase